MAGDGFCSNTMVHQFSLLSGWSKLVLTTVVLAWHVGSAFNIGKLNLKQLPLPLFTYET